jgi:galactoside O-acetyltransferase
MEALKEHTVHGDSVLLPSFYLDIRQPVPGKTFVRIGDQSIIGSVFIFETTEGTVTIGSRVNLSGGTVICRTHVEIGDDVVWEGGPGGYLYDHASHSMDYRERIKDMDRQLSDYYSGNYFIASKDWSVVPAKPITIHDKVGIGANCIILTGVTVGEGAIILPGSVVTRNVPA